MGEQAAQTRGVERTAFYLDSQGDSLLVWLHQPAGGARFAHGVVICPPIGVEQLNAHRAIRHLADAVAAQGFAVVRFDYAGTGDASGVDEDPRRMQTWLANIGDVAGELRQRWACQQISLIGLRMGAALAALTAVNQAFDNLVLWAPVVKGGRYCRELKALSRMAEGSSAATRDPALLTGLIKAAGFVTTAETAEAIGTIDLTQSKPRCTRVLIVDRNDTTANTALRDHYLGVGVDVEHVVQPGYVDMMAEPHYTRVPFDAITHIAQWLGDKASAGSTTASPSSLVRQITLQAADGHVIHERLCVISSDPCLFGILCEPAHATDDSRPLILLLSAGTAHHIGPGRIYVEMARQLALKGFRSLRLDFCGVGDSVLPDAGRENNSYAATAFRDIHLALSYAQTHCGASRVVLSGLCSGAYYAFQSAVQFNNPALVESLLINPRTYFWKDGMSLGDTDLARASALHYYLRTMADPKKWRRLLSGRSDAGVWGGIRLFAERVLARPKTAPSLPTAKSPAASEVDHPAHEDLPADLDRVVQAGRRLSLFCATTDPGHFLLMYKARRKAAQMNRNGMFEWVFVDNADHTFSDPDARQRLIEKITAYLGVQYPGQATRASSLAPNSA